MLPLLTRMKRTALDLLFPRWCLGCGREGDIICSSCYARFAADRAAAVPAMRHTSARRHTPAPPAKIKITP